MALRGTLIHHKTLHLAGLLGIAPCFALGLLEAMWHATGAQTPNGAIGRMSNQAIASVLLYPGDADALVNALLTAGHLDEDRTHRLIVHNWHKWADDHVHARLYRNLERFANGAIPKQKKVGKEEKASLEQAWRELLAGAPPLLMFESTASVAAAPSDVETIRLPTAAGGSLPEPEPVPVPEPGPAPAPIVLERVAEPQSGAAAALTEASQQVLLHCSVSGTSAAGLQSSIAAAIALECRRLDKPPEEYACEVAQIMIDNHAEYVRAGPDLRYTWSPKKFFEEGHWRNFQGWPLDRDRQRANANVGVFRPN